MKKYISIIIIIIFFTQFIGCYSLEPISLNEINDIENIDNQSVRITLNKGEIITSQPYYHTFILRPSEYIIGVGKKYNAQGKFLESFYGKIYPYNTDSLLLSKSDKSLNVWLKSKERIKFIHGNYFDVTKEAESGIWYWNEKATNKIDQNEIKSLETDKLNIVTTSLLALGGALIVTIAILSSKFKHEGSLVGNGSF